MAETRRKPGTAPSTATERLRRTLLQKDFPPLSAAATEFVRRRPQEARSAVAAALEAAARQSRVVLETVAGQSAAGGPAKDIPDQLKPFVVDSPEHRSATIGASAAAERLQVSRTTIYDWASKGTLLAWKVTRRGLCIPAEQILGPRKVVPGLPEILDAIGDPELAWAFLTQEWPFEDETAVPLEKLKAGQVRQVVDAAPGFGAVFS